MRKSLLVLEVSQGRQCFFEISSMPYGHRVRTNKIRTDLHSNSICSSVLNNTVRKIVPSARPEASGISGWLQKILPDNRPLCDVQNDWAEMPRVGNQMWTATVDFTKAFDSVAHKSIWKALKACDIKLDYISLLKNIYRDQKASVQTDEESNIFEIREGTKQGDQLSSLQFNTVLQYSLKDDIQRWQKKKEWEKTWATTTTTASLTWDLQMMCHCLHPPRNSFGKCCLKSRKVLKKWDLGFIQKDDNSQQPEHHQLGHKKGTRNWRHENRNTEKKWKRKICRSENLVPSPGNDWNQKSNQGSIKCVVNNAAPEASRGQKEARSIGTNLFILVFLALAFKLVGVWFWALTSKMVWPLITQGNLYFGGWISICGKSLIVHKNLKFLSWKSVTADGSLLSPTGGVKGMYLAPHIHEHLATANCVHPHAQHEQPGAHCEQWHGHHKAHWRVQCAVLSTPRTVCWCTCVHTSHLWLKVSPCVSFHIIHVCALVSCLLSGLSSPVSLLLPPVPLPALPDVHLGAWWDLHGRSPVRLQLGEHGHSGLCHTPHISSIFKFLFEEFVDAIFPSFSWSPDRSVDPVSCAQFRVPVSSLSQPSITWWRGDSQCQFPFHFLWVLFCGGVLVVLGTRLLKSRRKCWKLKMMNRRKVN